MEMEVDGSHQSNSAPSSAQELTADMGPSITNTGFTVEGSGKATIRKMNVYNISGNNNFNEAKSSKISSKEGIEFNTQETIHSFEGREDFIETLHEEIGPHTPANTDRVLSKLTVITGLPGIGKTQTVRKYVEKYKANYYHIIWIGADTLHAATNCILRLAAKTKIDTKENDKPKEVPQLIQEIYDNLTQKSSLIIYDNAEQLNPDEDGNGLEFLLPKRLKLNRVIPSIIVTSRNKRWNNLRVKPLPGLTEQECFRLLKSQLNFEHIHANLEQVREVQKVCEGLPIFIQQVISAIKDENEIRDAFSNDPYTMEEFLHDLSQTKSKLVQTVPEGMTLDGYTIFQMAFERLRTKNGGELSLQCLHVMSLLSPDHIPTKLLVHLLTTIIDFSTTKQEGTSTEDAPPSKKVKYCTNNTNLQISQALKHLQDFSMITNCGKFYQIHRVVQTMKLEENDAIIPENEKCAPDFQTIIQSFHNFLKSMASTDIFVHEILENGLRLTFHAENEWFQGYYSKFQETLLEKLDSVANYKGVAYLLSALVKTQMDKFGTEHEETIMTKHKIGVNLNNQGLYNEAAKTYNEVLALQVRILGDEHPHTIATKHGIAVNLNSQGLYEEAGKYYNEVLATQTRVMGIEHPKTITTQYNIAANLIAQNLYVEAGKKFHEVLALQSRILGEEHPLTIATKHCIAVILNDQGEYVEAGKTYQEILEMQKRILGDDHPHAIITKHNIAVNLNNQGFHEEALKTYREVLATRIRILGDEHPHTIITKQKMVINLNNEGLLEEAATFYNQILVFQRKTLGDEHPETIRAKFHIAHNLNARGFHEEALKTYKEVLVARIRILGDKHPETIKLKDNFALNFNYYGWYEEAGKIFNEILVAQTRILGDEHPDTLKTKDNIAKNSSNQRLYDELAKTLEKVL